MYYSFELYHYQYYCSKSYINLCYMPQLHYNIFFNQIQILMTTIQKYKLQQQQPLTKTKSIIMDIVQWIDVTTELQNLRQHMKLMELVKDDRITLQDCMQAQEINDQKMDPKWDICKQHTISHKLQTNHVLLPQSLTMPQTASILCNILQLQCCYLQDQPFSSTIYQFSYLYDRTIWQNSLLFKAILQSVHAFGSYVFDVVKQAGSIKEDDVTISGFSFSKNLRSCDEIGQFLLQAQKKFEAQYKKSDDKVSYNFVMNFLKLRRALHLLNKNMGVNFDPKNQKKIQTDIQSFKKKIAALRQVKYEGRTELVKGVFFPDINKALKAHFGPRPLKLLTLQQSYQQLQNICQQLQLFFPIPSKTSQIKNRTQILQSKPYNAVSKSYIKANIFSKQHYILTTLKSEDSLLADINDWTHLSQTIKQNQKFKNLISTATPVISQTIYRLLANSMRWHWQCSKIYQDYNVLVHMANDVDAGLVGVTGKQLYVSSWFYYYGLELMIKQVLVGFENMLYEASQLKYVFYVLENVLGISQKNGNVHLRYIDKTIFPNFNDNNLNKNIKKKMNENQLRMLANFIFRKGQYLYFRALFKTICILHNRKLLQNKFEQTEQLRVKNRFRIFKNVLFMKVIDYSEYRKTIEQICAKQGEYLGQSLEQLKEVKKIYSLFNQFKEDQTYYRQHQDAKILTQLSIKASIVVMTLKMNANKKYSVDLSGRFPQFKIQ